MRAGAAVPADQSEPGTVRQRGGEDVQSRFVASFAHTDTDRQADTHTQTHTQTQTRTQTHTRTPRPPTALFSLHVADNPLACLSLLCDLGLYDAVFHTPAAFQRDPSGEVGAAPVLHTQRHRHTETQRHRDTETQRHRDTDTQRHKDTETQETQRHRHTPPPPPPPSLSRPWCRWCRFRISPCRCG